jgi:hypothetical protein
LIKPRYGFKIDRRILANRRVWATTSFNPNNPISSKGFVFNQKLRIFLRVNVVGDSRHVVTLAQSLTQSPRQVSFSTPGSPRSKSEKMASRSRHYYHAARRIETPAQTRPGAPAGYLAAAPLILSPEQQALARAYALEFAGPVPALEV